MAIDPIPSHNSPQKDSKAIASINGSASRAKTDRSVSSAISELETIIRSLGEEQKEIESLCKRTQSNLAKTKAILESL